MYFTAQGTIESSDYKNPQQTLPYTNSNYDFGGIDFLGNPGNIQTKFNTSSNVSECISGIQEKSSSAYSYIKLSPLLSPIYDSGYLKK